jgi:hypothetical protein
MVWRDVRNGGFDVYLQRLLADGAIAPGWPENGIPVSTAPESQYGTAIIPDGTGGAFIVWEDARDTHNGNHSHDIYLQRILSTGVIATGWPVDGVAVCQADEWQWLPRMTADGQGGVLIAWEDYRNGNFWDRVNGDIYLQRFTGSGVAAPGWPPDGLPVCTSDAAQGEPVIVSDGEGGAILAWVDTRNGEVDIYAHRISGNGAAADGWTADGVLLCSAAGDQTRPTICSDGAGGALVAWADFRTQQPGYFYLIFADLYIQRVTGRGSLAVGWPAEGVPVCTATDAQYAHVMAADGSGGALLTWIDYRGAEADIYAARVTASGARAPGWSVDGTPVSTAEGYQYRSTLVGDGKGGAFFAFERFTNTEKIYAQHLDGAGQIVPGWPEAGVPLALAPPNSTQLDPGIVSAGSGAIVAWEDGRDAPGPQGRDIYAQRVTDDVVVAAAVSFVSALAEPGRVVLAWWSAAADEIQPLLDRRSMSSEWRRLGAIEVDGSGNLRYEDRAVERGQRYGYRLTYRQGGREFLTEEVWVQVPGEQTLELEGFRPNPARGDLVVAFALPVAGQAVLEVLDAGGRRVLAQEATLGPGRHVVRFVAQDLRPGIYWIRLRQGNASRVTRGILLR